jgi:hypothetical protein
VLYNELKDLLLTDGECGNVSDIVEDIRGALGTSAIRRSNASNITSDVSMADLLLMVLVIIRLILSSLWARGF